MSISTVASPSKSANRRNALGIRVYVTGIKDDQDFPELPQFQPMTDREKAEQLYRYLKLLLEPQISQGDAETDYLPRDASDIKSEQ